MRPRLCSAPAGMALLLILVAGGSAGGVLAAEAAPEGAAVLVEDYVFQPALITFRAGGTVTWTLGTDPEQHTVTPRDAAAFDDSGQLSEGDTYEVTFDRPGTFEYLCTLHPTMVGSVTVEALAAPSATVAPSVAATPPVGTPVASSPGPAAAPSSESTAAVPIALAAAVIALGIVGLLAVRRRRPS